MNAGEKCGPTSDAISICHFLTLELGQLVNYDCDGGEPERFVCMANLLSSHFPPPPEMPCHAHEINAQMRRELFLPPQQSKESLSEIDQSSERGWQKKTKPDHSRGFSVNKDGVTESVSEARRILIKVYT